MANIETRTVLPNEKSPLQPSLEKCTFFIKDYQRGYRWEEQQVKSFLDDLLEFNHNNHTVKYCMQPLVVKKVELNAELHERGLSELISPNAGNAILNANNQPIVTVEGLLSFLQQM